MIPANDSVTLRIRFRSEELGQFDQTLNFEIMGTRRRYQLFCRGVCSFPTISREPRVVFPHRRKYRKPEEIVHKKYVLSNETFEFGPLLCGKSKLLWASFCIVFRILICIEQAVFRLCLVWGFLLNWDVSGGGGGRGEPHSIRYKVCVPPQRVGLNSRFYLKTGVDFVHYSLKSGMVIKRAYSQLSHNGHQEKFPAFLLSF